MNFHKHWAHVSIFQFYSTKAAILSIGPFCDSQEQADSFWSNPSLISLLVVERFRYNQKCAFLYQKQTALTAYVLPEIVFSALLCPKLFFFSVLKVVCFLSGQSTFELHSFKHVQKNSVYFDIKCRSFLFCPKQC